MLVCRNMLRVRRLLRRGLGLLLVLVALGLVAGKLWLEYDGPYIEALEPYPFCDEAKGEIAAANYQDAMELAEAGGCNEELRAARSAWNEYGAMFQRCVDGVWTGRADDTAGLVCAIASDLVVFGDVRDLARQGATWLGGGETDPLLVALSTAGIALTFAPQLGAGVSLLKGARRAGAVSEPLARTVVRGVESGAWRPLTGLLTDAGRISVKVGPAKGTRALAYADDADELRALARFVEEVPHPLLGLKWGGKGATRLADDALYTQALKRGPEGVRLAVQRGGKALLARHPLVVFLAKTVYKNGAALVQLILRHLTWGVVLVLFGLLLLVGLFLARPRERRRGRPARYRTA